MIRACVTFVFAWLLTGILASEHPAQIEKSCLWKYLVGDFTEKRKLHLFFFSFVIKRVVAHLATEIAKINRIHANDEMP
jgi:hypothetical protein